MMMTMITVVYFQIEILVHKCLQLQLTWTYTPFSREIKTLLPKCKLSKKDLPLVSK